ncbi:MAG TPA: phosphatidylinositol-specific phospholipase C domain-containing protein [Abditibacteriaceae bacterium]|jgi:hypothetical protein
MSGYRTWMADNKGIHSRKLKQICLPASHDSGTYNLSDTLTTNPSPELANIVNEGKRIADQIEALPGSGLLIPNPAQWATTQIISAIKKISQATSRTIADQLNGGIRCLDLRIFYNKEDQQFYTYHGLRGSPMKEILQDIRSFLASTKGEIVYVTMGHWQDFSQDQDKAFADLVKAQLGEYAYMRQGDTDNYTNNPFEQTYEQIISQSGKKRSTVILVNDRSSDPIFWPRDFSPPFKESDNVIAGGYTDTSDREEMIAKQSSKFEATKRPIKVPERARPFALYMTLTPQEDEAIKIVVSSFASTVSEFPTPSILGPVNPMALALRAIAGLLEVYKSQLPWTQSWASLHQLSEIANKELENTLSKLQPLDTTDNRISFLYLDYYEDTRAIDIAIQYSGGIPSKYASIRQIFGATNAKNNHPEIFGVGTSGSLFHTWFDEKGWHDWQANFLSANFNPISVFAVTNVKGNNNLEVFAIDEDGVLWHAWYAQNGWNQWEKNFGDDPASSGSFHSHGASDKFVSLHGACDPYSKNLELFAVDHAGALWHNWFDTQWHEWRRNPLGAKDKHSRSRTVIAAPNAMNNTLEVFDIDTDGVLWHNRCSNSGWQDQWDRELSLSPAPTDFASFYAATCAIDNHLEVFAVDKAGVLWHNWFGTQWNGWTSGFKKAPADLTSVFAVTNSVNNHLEVFAIDRAGVLWHTCRNKEGWIEWENWQTLHGVPALRSIFGVTNAVSGSLEIFGVDNDFRLWHCWYPKRGGWQKWHQWEY